VQLLLGLLSQATGSSNKRQELLGDDDTHDAVAKHHTITTAAVRISEGRDADDAFKSFHEAFAWSAVGRLVLGSAALLLDLRLCWARCTSHKRHSARPPLVTSRAALAFGLCALVSTKEDTHPVVEMALTVVRERMASRATTTHEVEGRSSFNRLPTHW
jgi:hypothetical protein